MGCSHVHTQCLSVTVRRTGTNYHCWCPHKWYKSIPDLPDFHLLSRGRQQQQNGEAALVFVAQSCCAPRLINARLLLNAESSRVPLKNGAKLDVFQRSSWFSATQTFSYAALRNMFAVSMGQWQHNSLHVRDPVCNYFSEQYWPAQTLGGITASREVQVHLSQLSWVWKNRHFQGRNHAAGLMWDLFTLK